MKIGLLDVDGHHFPNLALSKLSAYHKAAGDTVEFVDFFDQYDIVYLSKVFTFTKDNAYCVNAEKIIKAGTGYRDYQTTLPDEIEHICPDYSIYNSNYAIGFTTRGCINNCSWCIVPRKEGNIRPGSPLSEFIGDKRKAILLDNNALAHPFGLSQMEESIRKGIMVDYNQGLEARIVCGNRDIARLLARMKWIRYIRFAADTKESLSYVIRAVEILKDLGIKPYRIFCYVLIKDVPDALYRINVLRKIGVMPFAQPYRDFENRIAITHEQRRLARWCNHKATLTTCTFEEYKL